MTKTENFIPSVNSALRVLELLMEEKYQSATLSEISIALSINISTCLRILKTLQKKHFVSYDEQSKKYQLGFFPALVGDRAKEINNYLSIIANQLSEAQSDIKHMLLLSQPINDAEMVYVAKEESQSLVRLTANVGEKFPIIVGAMGKCFMAHLPQEKAEDILKNFAAENKLPHYAENSIATIDAYKKEIEKIRQDRFSESHSEYIPGVSAIACPIFNSKKEVAFIVGIYFSGSLNHLEKQELVEKLQKLADQITGSVSVFI
ncbi:IclR family transcriptional regulator [Halalkalibacter alkaliphilus]|uniref:IclR family transcriptional regulator n=1 Tax=Halalkalibacter alkaliphilus TaxID=2917993 RepID=A0A9X2CXI0_9BACI|nr:IclR family transcriptional regulator [Halalkalibacter alkaliphilus]MCL7749609.1 IclR family transcriptional regulator [Halalkalibacter alkaliphilus]